MGRVTPPYVPIQGLEEWKAKGQLAYIEELEAQLARLPTDTREARAKAGHYKSRITRLRNQYWSGR